MKRATYHPSSDAAYFTLSDEKISRTKQIDSNLYQDETDDGEIVGLEVLFASKVLPEKDLKKVEESGKISPRLKKRVRKLFDV